ncbi:MAG TPA: DUF1566 domain-containing protein [Desulfobulbus sp.]|nr:DUF1566 domain-containing protein [Desulfobulbus sp.]
MNRIFSLFACAAMVFAFSGSVAAGNNSGAAFSIWPDTGQTVCCDANGNVLDPCPAAGQPFYGQDAQYDGPVRSYTILGGGAMVHDNVTGLIWERKQNKDGTKDYTNPHDADNTYTWCDINSATNGGNEGTCGEHDTKDFIDALNAENFGGHSDWRLPTIKELITLDDYGRYGPAINVYFFPGVSYGDSYWSATTSKESNNIDDAFWDDVGTDGGDYLAGKSIQMKVRAVRGGYELNSSRFVDNGDGTITDTITGLQWQKFSMDLDSDGFPDVMNWQQALSSAENMVLAGFNDWRLPNINELKSIVDYNRVYPNIDTAMFPDTMFNSYWTSTTFANYRDQAMRVSIVTKFSWICTYPSYQ